MNNKAERREQILSLLHSVDLFKHKTASVATFSGGMRQRFGVAQALLGDPKVLIVDEPTAGLDPFQRQTFLDLLSEAGEDKIIILSTHIVEDVREVTIEPIPAMMFIDRKKEEPLSLASDQQYLVYNKADWVMWSLKHYIGKEKMHAVMQKYLQDFGQKGPPYPTTLELISYLKDAAGPDFHQLIEDQWNRITYWELSYGEGDVKITQNQDGTYLVEIPFEIDKKISSEEKPKQVSVTEIDGKSLESGLKLGFMKMRQRRNGVHGRLLKEFRLRKKIRYLVLQLRNALITLL